MPAVSLVLALSAPGSGPRALAAVWDSDSAVSTSAEAIPTPRPRRTPALDNSMLPPHFDRGHIDRSHSTYGPWASEDKAGVPARSPITTQCLLWRARG